MKVVINACFGGFSLSPKAIRRMAELQGRPCYFFVTGRDSRGNIDIHKRVLVAEEQIEHGFFSAFDVPNPDEVMARSKDWHEMTKEEKDADSALYQQHQLDSRPENRADPLLIQVVEELGKEADGFCAQLKIIEIPDGIEWEIDEYDGSERIDEKHNSWS